jgi:hypothetical protein
MSLITLEQFKEHARIDGNDEDASAQVKVDAANNYVLSYLENPLPHDWQAPDELVQAALLIASHWWERRETAFAFSGAFNDIPISATDLISNFRVWQF